MKSQFDAIVEGQKKAMDFWADMAEKMQKSFTGVAKSETTSAELLEEWAEQQQAFWKEFTAMEQPEEAFKKAPDQMRKWIEWQTAYGEKWLKFYQQNAEKLGWKVPELDGFANPSKLAEQTFKQWKEWLGDGRQFVPRQIMEKMPFNMQPHFKNFIDSYQRIYRHWEPIQKMIQSGIYDQKVIEKYFSTDVYHKLVNQIMGYKAVGNISEAIENVNTWFEKVRKGYKEEWGNWSSVSENWRMGMKEKIDQGNLPYFEVATDLTQRMRDHLVPFENVMAQGRETEIFKLLRDLQFKYVSFLLRSTELQTMVYESGAFTLPDLIKDYAEQYQKTNETPDYQTFFNAYVNQLEEGILEVLHSDDYSKLQSEVSVAGTALKSMNEKLLELWFADVPFLTRSDGDDFARENKALRKKIRSLERRLELLEQRMTGGLKKSAPTLEMTEDLAKKKLIEKIGRADSSQRDDLKLIKGVGPKLEKALNDIGVYTYQQLSRLSNQEYELIDQLLHVFQGRSKRDHWAEQARELLATPA